MKHAVGIRWIVGILTAIFLVGLIASPVLAQTNEITEERFNRTLQGIRNGAAASLYISSYTMDYTLSRDAEKRSLLTAKETITAEFPNWNANRGIERFIPHEYKGHPTKLNIASVTDEVGKSLEYRTIRNGDTTTLRIGNPDVYAHGTKTYVITYTQRDVTHFFENTNRTEWYWDTNGVGWKIPIRQLTVNIAMDDAIRAEMQGTPQCYQGRSGSTQRCTLVASDSGFTVSASGLARGENITVAFGFPKDTFAPYAMSLFEQIFAIWRIWFFVTIPLTALLLIILSVTYYRKRTRSKELHTIPAEYIPPRGVSVVTSGQIVLPSAPIFSAQLIDFAVRHYIEIVETQPKSTWRLPQYDIHVIRDVSTLLEEEREILSDMFGHVPAVGERLSLKTLRYNQAYTTRTIDNDKKLSALIDTVYLLRAPDAVPGTRQYFRKWSAALLILSILLVAPLFLIPTIVAFSQSFVIKPLTDKGLELRRYLLGLSKYIKAAEKDRIRMLQGPDTAEKVGRPVNVGDSAQLVKLYERTLPYAIFFGHERKWAKYIGDFYEQTGQSPDWYSGTSAFNAAAFGTALSSFSHSAASSSGSSSSSGGSSGGGSSGGGGGGGGGGGW